MCGLLNMWVVAVKTGRFLVGVWFSRHIWVVAVVTHCCGSSQTPCGGLVTLNSESPLLPTQRPANRYFGGVGFHRIFTSNLINPSQFS